MIFRYRRLTYPETKLCRKTRAVVESSQGISNTFMYVVTTLIEASRKMILKTLLYGIDIDGKSKRKQQAEKSGQTHVIKGEKRKTNRQNA